MAPRCASCGSEAARRKYRLRGRSIWRCRACGLVYQWPLPSENEIRQRWALLHAAGESALPEFRGYFDLAYDDAPDNPLVRAYERWLALLERHHPPGRLLDIGCGTGQFLAVARRRGWEVCGIEESAAGVRHAREHFGLDVREVDFAEFARSGGERFAAVTLWDVIEHARDPVGLLVAVRRCLVPGGIVGLVTPNQRNIVALLAGMLYRLSGGTLTAPLEKYYILEHFTYFTACTLAASAGRARLEIVHLEREVSELGRYALSPAVRLALRVLLALASVTRLETRLLAVARATDPADSGHRVG